MIILSFPYFIPSQRFNVSAVHGNGRATTPARGRLHVIFQSYAIFHSTFEIYGADKTGYKVLHFGAYVRTYAVRVHVRLLTYEPVVS